MDERMRFVIRLKDGESMASLCRELSISRKTGYKIFERCEECGLEGLSDRTGRPFAIPRLATIKNTIGTAEKFVFTYNASFENYLVLSTTTAPDFITQRTLWIAA